MAQALRHWAYRAGTVVVDVTGAPVGRVVAVRPESILVEPDGPGADLRRIPTALVRGEVAGRVVLTEVVSAAGRAAPATAQPWEAEARSPAQLDGDAAVRRFDA